MQRLVYKGHDLQPQTLESICAEIDLVRTSSLNNTTTAEVEIVVDDFLRADGATGIYMMLQDWEPLFKLFVKVFQIFKAFLIPPQGSIWASIRNK